MPPMDFRATVMLGGKTATGIQVPADVVEALNAGKRPPVVVTIGGYTYRTTVAPYGGAFFIPLAAEHREAAGVAAEQEVDVAIELDTAPREVPLPEDLAAAMDDDARSAFDAPRVHPPQGMGALGRGGQEARDPDDADREDRRGTEGRQEDPLNSRLTLTRRQAVPFSSSEEGGTR